MASFTANRWDNNETVTDFIFLASKITADDDFRDEIKILGPWKRRYDKPKQCIKKQRQYFVNKNTYSQSNTLYV